MNATALNQIFGIVKTLPKETAGITLPSGRYAKIFNARNVMEYREYPKRVHVDIYNSEKMYFTKAQFDFFVYEDGTWEPLAMVENPKHDEEFNNNILREFYKSINPEYK